MIRRYIVTSPSDSRTLREALDLAINLGTNEIPLTAREEDGTETLEGVFTLRTVRYGKEKAVAEYFGSMSDTDRATINVSTHPEFDDSPARLTFIGQLTP